jgi:hypothetical protein
VSYAYTSDELISQIQRRGMFASSSNTLATADYLSFINDEIQTCIVPLVMSVREEFFVTSADQTITSGTASYAIPTRAIGSKLRNVLVLNGSDYVPLPRLEPEAVNRVTSSSVGQPEGYYIQGNNVVLYPSPGTSSTLRLSYFIRPNRCVALASTGTVSSTTSSTIVISGAVSGWSNSATSYDVVKGTPHFESRTIDSSATGGAGTTLTFSSVSTSIVAGDYVCLAGESPVPQIPVELHPLLAERVVVRALEAIGDPKVEVAIASADRMQKAAVTLLMPRSVGSSRYVINYNAPGFRGRRWGR